MSFTLLECSPKAGSVPQTLEHQSIRWVTPEEMRSMPFCPADAELIGRLGLARALKAIRAHEGRRGDALDP